MQVNAIGYVAPNATKTEANPTGQVQKEDFLKLLITQLTHQDPLNPTADTEFLAQLAQFSALEEMRNLNTSFKSFAGQQEIGQMAALIGKQVEVQTGENSDPISGTVQAIKRRDGDILLVINDQEYKPQDVVRVF